MPKAPPAARSEPPAPAKPKEELTRFDCTAPEKSWLARLDPADRAAIEAGLGYAMPAITAKVEWVGEVATKSQPSLKGKVVIIQSLDSNSNGTGSVDKIITALKATESDAGLVVIGVQIPVKVDASITRLAKSKSKANLCVDRDGSWCDALGAYKKPVNLVIDRSGAIRYAGLTEKGVAAAAKLLLEETPRDAAPAQRPIESAAPAAPVAFPMFTEPVSSVSDLRGKPSPELVVDRWITDEPATTGKVIIVDFFFTGCPPCRAAIPHMNEIASHYKDSVSVVGVSFETKSTFDSGLKKHRLKERDFDYAIGLDTSRRIINAFGVQGYPSIAIISSDGIVRWQGHPGSLTNAVIDSIVAANAQLAAGSRPKGSTTRGWVKSTG